jgi:hypothetical protein
MEPLGSIVVTFENVHKWVLMKGTVPTLAVLGRLIADASGFPEFREFWTIRQSSD